MSDLAQRMPVVRQCGEEPGFAATGLLLLGVQRSQLRARVRAHPNPTMKQIANR